MYPYSAEDAAQTVMAAAAAYRALLDYYANAPSAAGHIVSLTLVPFNDTAASPSYAGGVSGGGNNTDSVFEDGLGSGNVFGNQRLEQEAAGTSYGFGDSSGSGFGSGFSGNTSPSLSPSPSPGSISGGGSSSTTTSTTEMPVWLIPSYSVILLFAVLGNLLVISTLVQNRRMRTITNVFLLNLAISDMLLGVLCMPVTLVGTLLRNFIFGEFLCKLFQFSQAASVAVSSWTLVAISCERYYAICHPLRSRSWQTISHAYKIIGFIWLGGILCMTPIAVFSQLIPTSRPGYCKCRETWPDQGYEQFYNILLDFMLLVLPLLVLCVAYILITRTLYVGMAKDSSRIMAMQQTATAAGPTTAPSTGVVAAGGAAAAGPSSNSSNSCILVLTASTVYNESSNNNNGAAAAAPSPAPAPATATTRTTTTTTTTATLTTRASTSAMSKTTSTTTTTVTLAKMSSPSMRVQDAALRRSNEAKTLESKKRVVKMLFVLVLEFFICWTPLYVINTLSMFIGQALYEYIDYTSISYLQLLAYSSSCCNPITYCFMNASFRRAFVDTFKGMPWRRAGTGAAGGIALSASQVANNNPNALNANPGQAMGMGTWRTRSRHDPLNSVVHTSSATAADSPRL
ncbi:gastrin/cholecystokinin type B receptor [Drosophila miranda]|uniref:gastrin/cholecystokinin type B receptor n=1 Tax=Drosophila miranda TaxID=7229 RepID=UPI0007E7B3F5|nr:gastrin/cholecystokinin type B receptor [Drosophila miranda]